MVDSFSVAVSGEVPAGVTDVVVVDQAGGESQQPQRDAGADPPEGASAVGFEGELALAGPKHRLDPLAHGAQGAVAAGAVAAAGAAKAGTPGGHVTHEPHAP